MMRPCPSHDTVNQRLLYSGWVGSSTEERFAAHTIVYQIRVLLLLVSVNYPQHHGIVHLVARRLWFKSFFACGVNGINTLLTVRAPSTSTGTWLVWH